jgi:hypothetical protein
VAKQPGSDNERWGELCDDLCFGMRPEVAAVAEHSLGSASLLATRSGAGDPRSTPERTPPRSNNSRSPRSSLTNGSRLSERFYREPSLTCKARARRSVFGTFTRLGRQMIPANPRLKHGTAERLNGPLSNVAAGITIGVGIALTSSGPDKPIDAPAVNRTTALFHTRLLRLQARVGSARTQEERRPQSPPQSRNDLRSNPVVGWHLAHEQAQANGRQSSCSRRRDHPPCVQGSTFR